MFHKLTKADTAKIARKMLTSLEKKLCDMDIAMTFTDAAVEAVAEKGYDPDYGAGRSPPCDPEPGGGPLFPRKCWRSTVTANKAYSCDYRDGKFTFEAVEGTETGAEPQRA